MTKAGALQSFMESFGIPAYAEGSVPKDAEFPWITYDPVFDSWGGGEVGVTVNLWYYTESEKAPNDMAAKISEAVGLGGVTLPCDGGFIWIKRGSPFSQSIHDPTEPLLKRKYINLTVEYLTFN